jgi:intracellular septation protein
MSVIPNISSKNLKRLLTGSLLEFGPILVFLLSFHHFHIYKATFILMITTIVSTVLTYRFQKRLPYLALYVAFLTIVFGYMTIAYHQPRFIQMRDTLYDVTCALTLMVGVMINVSFLKLAFNEVISMHTRAWNKLTHAWIIFFIANALVNEYVRRTYTLAQWLDFKSFVVVATLIFGCTALYIVYEEDHSPQK